MSDRTDLTRPVRQAAIASASPEQHGRLAEDVDEAPDRRPAWVRRLDTRIVVAPNLPAALRVDRPLR